MMRGTVLGPDDSRLTRYLLGELPEEEQTRLEEEYFNSPDALEKLAAAEDELIDDYVDGRLEGDRRKRFEQRLATSPERWQRVEFARQLGRYVASRVEPAPARAFRPFASP